MTLTTFREWAQTIVLVGTVISSCVVIVFKVGGYTTRLETAVADATRTAAQAVAENMAQQKQINDLAEAERDRQKRERQVVERIPRRAIGSGNRPGTQFGAP